MVVVVVVVVVALGAFQRRAATTDRVDVAGHTGPNKV